MQSNSTNLVPGEENQVKYGVIGVIDGTVFNSDYDI